MTIADGQGIEEFVDEPAKDEDPGKKDDTKDDSNDDLNDSISISEFPPLTQESQLSEPWTQVASRRNKGEPSKKDQKVAQQKPAQTHLTGDELLHKFENVCLMLIACIQCICKVS